MSEVTAGLGTSSEQYGQYGFRLFSDFQYHEGKHLFLRQHGLGEVTSEDSLKALRVDEAGIILNQLLRLIPTLDLERDLR